MDVYPQALTRKSHTTPKHAKKNSPRAALLAGCIRALGKMSLVGCCVRGYDNGVGQWVTLSLLSPSAAVRSDGALGAAVDEGGNRPPGFSCGAVREQESVR